MATYLSGTKGIGPFRDPNLYSKAMTPVNTLSGVNYNFAGEVIGNQQQPKPSSGNLSGGGGGGGTGDVLGTNTQSPVEDMNAAARADAEAAFSLIDADYNRNKALGEGQLSAADRERAREEERANQLLSEVRGQADLSRKRAKDDTESNIQDARSTAQDVQRKNRNVLRALGILNSSAAGEMLSKPFNQYDEQRAKLNLNLQRRNEELDQFLDAKTAEHANFVRQIVDQYRGIVDRIRTDLRFNDEQRSAARLAADVALKDRLSEIRLAQFNYQNQINALKNQANAEYQSLSNTGETFNYQTPGADLGKISSAGINVGQQARPQQVGIYGREDEESLSGLGLA